MTGWSLPAFGALIRCRIVYAAAGLPPFPIVRSLTYPNLPA